MKTFGYNKDIDIELATVIAVEPLKIKIDNLDMELESEDLIVAEQLLEHTRTMKIDKQQFTIKADVDNHDIDASTMAPLTCSNAGTVPIKKGDLTFEFTTVELTASEVTGEEVEVTFSSMLEVDDRVIVASVQNNQQFIVLDKAVF